MISYTMISSTAFALYIVLETLDAEKLLDKHTPTDEIRCPELAVHCGIVCGVSCQRPPSCGSAEQLIGTSQAAMSAEL